MKDIIEITELEARVLARNLKEWGLVKSNSEGMRVINQGAVYVAKDSDSIIIRVGKLFRQRMVICKV